MYNFDPPGRDDVRICDVWNVKQITKMSQFLTPGKICHKFDVFVTTVVAFAPFCIDETKFLLFGLKFMTLLFARPYVRNRLKKIDLNDFLMDKLKIFRLNRAVESGNMP